MGIVNIFFAFCNYTLKYCFKQIVFTLLVFSSLCLQSQESNTTVLYIHPETIVQGLDCIQYDEKKIKQDSLYIVKNTIFYSNQEFAIVSIENSTTLFNTAENDKVVVESNSTHASKEITYSNNKVQVEQIPIPFSLPVQKAQIVVSCVGISISNTSLTSIKKASKTNVICDVFFGMHNEQQVQKQNTISFKQKSKSFQLKIKYYNKPPPAIYG